MTFETQTIQSTGNSLPSGQAWSNRTNEKAPMTEQSSSQSIPARPNLQRSQELARAAAQTALDNGATDLVVLDMTGLTAIFDYFVIATGTSKRQIVSLSEDIRLKLEKELKDKRISLDGQDTGKWIVLDFGSVVIHLFDEDTRQFYSLETLWADAPNVTEELGIKVSK